MSSRATSVLLRLKQMDKKYKSSMEKTQEKFSDISGLSSDEKTEKSINSPKLLKAQLNIKLPETYVESVESFSSNSDDEDVKSVKVLDGRFNLSSAQLVKKINTSTSDKKDSIVEVSSQSSKKSEEKKDENPEESDGDSMSEDIEEVVESIKTSGSKKNGGRISSSLNESVGDDGEEYSGDSFESGSSESEGEDEETSSGSLREICLVVEGGNNDFIAPDSDGSSQKFGDFSGDFIKAGGNFREDENSEGEKKSESEEKNSKSEEKISETEINNSSTKTASKTSKTTVTTSTESESTSSKKIPLKRLKKTKNIRFEETLDKSLEKLKDKKEIYVSELTSEGKKKNSGLRKSSSKDASEKEGRKEEILVKKEKRSLSMIRYLRQIEENRQRLLVWPTNFVCSNISRNAVLKPLETPEFFNIIQPGNFFFFFIILMFEFFYFLNV